MQLEQWARKWRVPPEALVELRAAWGVDAAPVASASASGLSESAVQANVRLEAARMGVWLTRNNVGALLDTRGVPVRFGLANESKEQNRQVKSGDLIGVRPVLIAPHHVGTVIGQFVSREIKHANWKWTGDKHEQAQLNWVKFITSKGGDAAFASGPGSFGGSTHES